MSHDIEDLLRRELQGAASGAPHHLGVDDQDVLSRGRRVVVRRRALTAVGAAVAALAVAGTIGVLAPRTGDTDTLPALPTPTATPTPEVTLTTTPSASATATPTATPSTSDSPRPSASSTSTGPRPTASRTNTPTATTGETDWTEPVTIGGVSYRTRLVDPSVDDRGYMTVTVDVEADGQVIFTKTGQDYGEWGTRGLGPNVLLLYNVKGVQDVVSENGEPVEGEGIGTFRMPFPGTDTTIVYTIVSLPRPVTRNADGSLRSLMVLVGGETYGLGVDDPDF